MYRQSSQAKQEKRRRDHAGQFADPQLTAFARGTGVNEPA